MHVPGVRVLLQYRVDAQGAVPSELTQLTLTAGQTALPNGLQADAPCSDTGHFHSEGQQDVVLSSHTPLNVRLRIPAASSTIQATNTDGSAAGRLECNDLGADRLMAATFTIDLLRVLYSSGQDAPCVGETVNASSPYQLRINVCALYEGLGP